jgi:hypothetical protein
MFRARDPQRALFSARNQYQGLLKPGSFYALLTELSEQLFDDYKFAFLYHDDNGRPCIPPGQMFTLLLLQMHDGCSDEESVERARCDIRWAAALDIELGSTFCGRSTLQEFRARVLLNAVAEDQFKAVLGLARERGLLKGALQVALDTTPILGRGAVQDTYNLIATAIRKLGSVIARIEKVSPEYWAGLHDFRRYWDDTSLKGAAGIDWSDDSQRRVFLNSLVADAQRILLLADKLAKSAIKDDAAKIEEASALLRRLIAQDLEPEPQPPKRAPSTGPAAAGQERESGHSESDPPAEPSSHLLGQMVRIKQGTAPDRVISVHDPDMRHGRKSASKRFDGHKLSVVVDTASKLTLAVEILAGNAGDSQGALELVRQAEANTGLPVKKAIGDCAYGDGPTRQAFKQSGVELSAKVPASASKDLFPKSRFTLDLTNMIATCPAGVTTEDYDHWRLHGEITKRFRFSASTCGGCRHRNECLRANDKQRGLGRTVLLNLHEELLVKARAHQASPAFREDIKARQSVEHGLARLTQLGIRQARYFGRAKTKYQALMIAMAANIIKIGAIFPATLTAALVLSAWAAKYVEDETAPRPRPGEAHQRLTRLLQRRKAAPFTSAA